jgi:Terminase small subunit
MKTANKVASSKGKTTKPKNAKKAKKEVSLVVPDLEKNVETVEAVVIGESGLNVELEKALQAEIDKRIESGELLQMQVGKKFITFDPKEYGMRPTWRRFVDEYFKNGFNGKQAYLVVFPNCDEKSAEANASRLLRNDKVVALIKRRLEAEEIDDDWVYDNLKAISKYHDSFRIQAAVAATLGIAKARGMLNDNKRQPFTAENPAVFLPPFSKEEIEEMTERRKKLGRIIE